MESRVAPLSGRTRRSSRPRIALLKRLIRLQPYVAGLGHTMIPVDDHLVGFDTEFSLMLCTFRTSFIEIFVDLS